MTTYRCIPTTIGQAKIDAAEAGTPLNITAMAVGDGDGADVVPAAGMTHLVNEVYRHALASFAPAPGRPNTRIAFMVVPAESGPITVREIGIFDEDGDMIFVGNFPTSVLPDPALGSARSLGIKAYVAISDAATINLVIDNSVYATIEYVDEKMADHLAAENPHEQYALLAGAEFAGPVLGPTPDPADSSNKLVTTELLHSLLNLMFHPGFVMHTFDTEAPPGWVVRDGKTIGNADSGATSRANADCQALFAKIWNKTDNTTNGGSYHLQDNAGLPIARGASAAADWEAGCRIPLPNAQGRVDRGLNAGMTGIDAERVLGTDQADAFQTHNHKVYSTPYGGSTTSSLNHVPDPSTATLVFTDPFVRADPLTDIEAAEEIDGGSGVPRTAAETRMANTAYLPIIKL